MPQKKSIPLATGIHVHKGIEWMLKEAVSCQNIEELATAAGNMAATAYEEEVTKSGFLNTPDEEMDKVRAEQCALASALVQAFAYREIPKLVTQYDILDVEREEAFVLENTVPIVLQGRLDAVIRQKGTSDIYVLSLKTASEFSERMQKQAEHDTQGLSEIALLENRLRERNSVLYNLHNELMAIAAKYAGAIDSPDILKSLDAASEYIHDNIMPDRVMGVKMIYLIKGTRLEQKDSNGNKTGSYVTYSPLIRGYRRLLTTQWEYAHSWRFPNPANKSGYGTLGRDWEPFNVWENDEIGGVTGWIKMLAAGQVQPECGDILQAQLIHPLEFFRREDEISSWLLQAATQEARIARSLKEMSEYSTLREFLDRWFPMHRGSCHWPTDCPNLAICYRPHAFENPLENGYEYRIPHHDLEKQQLMRIYENTGQAR